MAGNEMNDLITITMPWWAYIMLLFTAVVLTGFWCISKFIKYRIEQLNKAVETFKKGALPKSKLKNKPPTEEGNLPLWHLVHHRPDADYVCLKMDFVDGCYYKTKVKDGELRIYRAFETKLFDKGE